MTRQQASSRRVSRTRDARPETHDAKLELALRFAAPRLCRYPAAAAGAAAPSPPRPALP